MKNKYTFVNYRFDVCDLWVVSNLPLCRVGEE